MPAPIRARTCGAMLLLTMGIWGLNLPVLKWLTTHFDSVLLAGLRMLAGLLALACLLRPLRLPHGLDGRDWRRLLVSAVLMVYLYQLLMTEGIRHSTATNGALMSAFQPVLASLVAMALLRERLGRAGWAGAVLGLAGVCLTILSQPSAEVRGAGASDLLILAGLTAYCVGAVMVQRVLVRVDVLLASIIMQAVGAGLLLVHACAAAAWQGLPPRSADAGWTWGAVLLSGALSTGIAGLLWNRAVVSVGMARASLWLYWVPVFGLATAVVVLGEPLTVWHLAGFGLVLTGTYLAARRPRLR